MHKSTNTHTNCYYWMHHCVENHQISEQAHAHMEVQRSAKTVLGDWVTHPQVHTQNVLIYFSYAAGDAHTTGKCTNTHTPTTLS